MIFNPRFAPGLRVSIDYTRIEKEDEIRPVETEGQFLLDYEDSFPGRIVRGPNLPDDPEGWAGSIISFDRSLINVAKTSLEAYDFQVDYTRQTQRFGEFRAYAVATRQPQYQNQVLLNSPVVDSVGFTGGPLKWRGNFGIDWTRGPLALSWNAQYYDSYLIYEATSSESDRTQLVRNQGSSTIPSEMYHDVIVSLRFDDESQVAGGLLANCDISVGIQNVFDEYPPILASSSPTNARYSSYGDPRLRRYTVSFRKGFTLQ